MMRRAAHSCSARRSAQVPSRAQPSCPTRSRKRMSRPPQEPAPLIRMPAARGSARSSTAKTPPPSQHLRNGSCPAHRASRARATRTYSTTSTWRWRAPTPTFSTFIGAGSPRSMRTATRLTKNRSGAYPPRSRTRSSPRSKGCHVGAKSSILITKLPEADATGNFKLITGAMCHRVNSDNSGRVTGVGYYAPAGSDNTIEAELVILTTFIYDNTRLPLISKTDKFPNGLANSSGQIGKHLMAHMMPNVYAMFDDRHTNNYMGPSAQKHTIDDFNA